MNVKDVMNDTVHHVSSNATLREAAEQMRDHDIGFIGIRNSDDSGLQGVITDRDITVRGVASGVDPSATTVDKLETEKVLYCFQNDDINTAANSMRDQKVYRLMVLDDSESKQLVGVVTLGDIVRNGREGLAEDVARDILGSVG